MRKFLAFVVFILILPKLSSATVVLGCFMHKNCFKDLETVVLFTTKKPENYLTLYNDIPLNQSIWKHSKKSFYQLYFRWSQKSLLFPKQRLKLWMWASGGLMIFDIIATIRWDLQPGSISNHRIKCIQTKRIRHIRGVLFEYHPNKVFQY